MGLMSGILFGSIGLGYVVYGKKAEAYGFLICGVLLMAYPYFVADALWSAALGALLTAGPFIVKRYF